VTIGPPISNTTFYVLDKLGQPVPIGVPGELYIGGAGVARGYWRDALQTSQKFVPDPFSQDSHARLYRTGDQVRYLPDGTLEFLGRLDNQVKIRGFRIETSEVEFGLKQFPGVRECVVVASDYLPGDKRLVAYVTTDGPPPASADLRRFLLSRLPEYMLPSVFVPLPSIPRTPNGKVDRRALPAPHADDARSRRDHVEPSTPAEIALAEICADLLQLDRVSVDDSLFDLGADSVQLFQIVARARDAGFTITPSRILSERSVRAICESLDKIPADPVDRDLPRLVPVSREKYRVSRSSLS
jgi:aryl carrier-like protein